MKQLLNNCLNNNHLSKFRILADAIFKQNCLLCEGKLDGLQGNIHAVCRACQNDMPWQPNTSCPQCGFASDGNVCGSCLSNPPDFDKTNAVFLYGFPIDAMMVRYKYGNMMHLSHLFGQFLSDKLALSLASNQIDFIIPMPMHPMRIKERGFNQAHEIAKVIAKNCRDKLDYKSVARIKLTPPQAILPLKDRVKNIKGAFQVNTDKLNLIQGKRIAIVDDVMTTGASLNELAKTLKKARASVVASARCRRSSIEKGDEQRRLGPKF